MDDKKDKIYDLLSRIQSLPKTIIQVPDRSGEPGVARTDILLDAKDVEKAISQALGFEVNLQ